MLRRTSKRVKEVVDKMRLPAVVRLSKGEQRKYGGLPGRDCAAAEKLQFVLRQLALMTAWCRITTLELPCCCPEMNWHDAERLARVLAQCPALAHLDLSENDIAAAGAASIGGVLAQCTALSHLNLSDNDIKADGAESLAGVLAQCAALAHLDLSYNDIGAAGAEYFKNYEAVHSAGSPRSPKQ